MASDPNEQNELIATINVTPLVDVMLVLLVIFMVTTPMMQHGVDVNLPKASTGSMKGDGENIVVSIDKEGAVYLGKENKIDLELLPEKIKNIFELKKDSDQKVYVKADTDIDYGTVMKVMAKLYQGGIYQVGLVTTPESK